MITFYQKNISNLIITTLVLLLFFTLNTNPASSPLVLAQSLGETSASVANNTLTPPSPFPDQDILDSSSVTNYSFPFEQSQQDSILPFSDSTSSEMNFNMFMESFVNSIFNGSSIFGGVGTSMVNGVKVSGIALNNNGTLSVTLSRSPEVPTGDSTTNMINNSVSTSASTKPLDSVSVIATRIPINVADILSLAALSSSQGMDNNMMMGDMGFNPFSILSSMQIGSNTITNVDWSVPSDCDNGFSWRRKY